MNITLTAEQQKEIASAMKTGGAVTLTFAKPVIDTGYNVRFSGREERYYAEGVSKTDYGILPMPAGNRFASRTISGNSFNSVEGAELAAKDGLLERLGLEAEVVAAYHRRVDALEWHAGNYGCYAPSVATAVHCALQSGVRFPFPYNEAGLKACMAFLNEVGTEKLRKLYYPKGLQ